MPSSMPSSVVTTVSRGHVIYCALDDKIPFCEGFLPVYCYWYVLIVGSLLWFLLYDIRSFKRLQIYIMITQAVAISVSTAFVKQHSVVDIFAAIPLGLLAENLVYGKTRLNRWIGNGV